MTEDVIKLYEHFNRKGCPDEILFGYFCDQPIPTEYYDTLNYDGDNNITGTLVDNFHLDKKGVDDTLMPNDEYIGGDIIINYSYRLTSDIDPIQLFLGNLRSGRVK